RPAASARLCAALIFFTGAFFAAVRVTVLLTVVFFARGIDAPSRVQALNERRKTLSTVISQWQRPAQCFSVGSSHSAHEALRRDASARLPRTRRQHDSAVPHNAGSRTRAGG